MSWEVQTMKSKTLSCKTTLYKKNLTRFMPFWVLYTLCLLMGLTMLLNRDVEFYFAMNLAACARFMAVVNCGYALLVGQLLFGDLYDSRMCSGIHSLPLRREEIFLINVLSGLTFSLLPTAIMTLCSLPLMLKTVVQGGMAIPFLWLAAVNLEYLFFFGIAVFSAFCAGNRLAMAVIYGIANFGSMFLSLMVQSLYAPMLPGVVYPYEWFLGLTPVVSIADSPLIIVERLGRYQPGTMTLQPSWWYVIVCALVGLVFLAAALQLYRKRSLETAGEFIAVKALRPVFLILFAVLSGVCLSMGARFFFGMHRKTGYALAFAFIGLSAGWFVGLMLLKKSLRIFDRKALIGFGALLTVAAASLLLTRLDIFGIASWVPEPDQVESVQLIPQYDAFGQYWEEREEYRLKKPEDVKQVTEIHRLAIEEGLTEEDCFHYYYDHFDNDPSQFGKQAGGRYTVPISLNYRLKDGSSRSRTYYIYADGKAGQLARLIFSRENFSVDFPENLALGLPADYVGLGPLSLEEKYRTRQEIISLEEAIRKDCQEGNMAPMLEYHPVPIWENGAITLPNLDLSVNFNTSAKYSAPGFYVRIYSDSVHTLQWLEQRGLLQKVLEEMKENGGQ